MDLTDFDYQLPRELIAQRPAPERDRSRLMVLDRAAGTIRHRWFRDLVEYLAPGDALVLNDTRVVPARLVGRRASGGGVEALVLEAAEDAGRPRATVQLLLNPAGRLKPGEALTFEDGAIHLTLIARTAEGHWVAASEGESFVEALRRLGRAPLPPYIRRPAGADPDWAADRQRYQTVFARREGAIAAPTAGLHFTPQLLAEIERLGVRLVYVTLHVGLGTFEPIRTERIEDHRMHAEAYEFPAAAAAAVSAARAAGRRVVAVGTTSVRVLETVWRHHQGFAAGRGETDLYIHPPYEFRAVDALVTNFHLPRSSLLLLVCAFAGPQNEAGCAGRELILKAYAEAVRERYRFYSYGDAMVIM